MTRPLFSGLSIFRFGGEVSAVQCRHLPIQTAAREAYDSLRSAEMCLRCEEAFMKGKVFRLIFTVIFTLGLAIPGAAIAGDNGKGCRMQGTWFGVTDLVDKHRHLVRC